MSNSLAGSHGAHKSELNQVMSNIEKILPVLVLVAIFKQ